MAHQSKLPPQDQQGSDLAFKAKVALRETGF